MPSKYRDMKRGKLAILCMLALLLLFGSCASSGSSAMRKAERQMEKMEKQSNTPTIIMIVEKCGYILSSNSWKMIIQME